MANPTLTSDGAGMEIKHFFKIHCLRAGHEPESRVSAAGNFDFQISNGSPFQAPMTLPVPLQEQF